MSADSKVNPDKYTNQAWLAFVHLNVNLQDEVSVASTSKSKKILAKGLTCDLCGKV